MQLVLVLPHQRPCDFAIPPETPFALHLAFLYSSNVVDTMLYAEWNRLRDQLRNKNDIPRLLASSPQHSYDTLICIFDQLYQRHLTINMRHIRARMTDASAMHDTGLSLLDIANRLDMPPVVLVRRFLEARFRLERKAITRALRDPSTLRDPRMQQEVAACVDVDDMFGPRGDRIRAVLGIEYEHLLCDILRTRGLQFETEDDLRRRGSFKTPDVLLAVPVAFTGHVVCWIDSKAKFADEYTLNKDYNDAVKSYANRFGPGMVVYWFGIIDDCQSLMNADDAILITDRVPDHMQSLPGTLLPHRTHVNVAVITSTPNSS